MGRGSLGEELGALDEVEGGFYGEGTVGVVEEDGFDCSV